MGLGAGGHSRLGQRDNHTVKESVAIVHQALAAGINFIDTAESYKTEAIIGEAIRSIDRRDVIISTKKSCKREEITPKTVRDSLELSLTQLGTDYIDVYNLHGVYPQDYDFVINEIVPTFIDLRKEGKIHFIGVTEMFNADKEHEMLQHALQHDDVWDVIMVGFNILNQCARERVFAQAIAKNIGVQIMFAVRQALSQPDKLREAVNILIEQGQLDPNEIDLDDPLGFLLHEGHAPTLTDAAYRFCRDEPGTHVILSGTGNPDHLRANVATLEGPPLPDAVTKRLRSIFRNATAVTGQ